MSVSSMISILLTLAFVLLLLGVSLKLLRRLANGGVGKARLRMDVVQRLSLSPKQGIAVVRVAERVVVVSTGEGGVHRLFELEESEVASLATVPTVPATAPDFASVMRNAWRGPATAVATNAVATNAVAATAVALMLMVLLPVAAHAQQPVTDAGRKLMQQLEAQQKALATPPARGGTTRTTPARGAARSTVTSPSFDGVVSGASSTASSTASSAITSAASAIAAASAITGVAPITSAAGNAPGAPAGQSLLDASVSKLSPQMDLRVGGGDGLRMSGTVGVVVMMGLLTLLPSLILMMTGFTRILIVLHFLRQALGTQSAPPSQLVAGLALLLTGFVMAPTLTEVNRVALTPWLDGRITQTEMLANGSQPLRAFMLRQTRRADIETFVHMSGQTAPATVADLPMVTLTSAFVISELRTAFQMGFAIFLPFIVIDIAVSAVLMSMGMMMLPPAMIALPFKLLLFVLADGWSLVVQSLVHSFR